eukprot:TRINITY_DN10633_c0_g1_i1.p1 TRINITY_DN10633_c0_g1~~TRINITY_DN10633_c0_g1_i1.p1  ORF type:complete len:511 (-),score=101.19 TRINITY_DN10633_c0_g1_i1:38-1570(-)
MCQSYGKVLIGLILVFAYLGVTPRGYIHINITKNLTNTPSDEAFLGFTNDWWVPYDPTYGEMWGNSGILTFDLTARTVINMVRGLHPASWRVGGTPQDTVIYDIGSPVECPVLQQGPYPYPMCLSMKRWGEILEFVNKTKVKFLFGLNAMYQRKAPYMHMNTSNIRSFLEYTSHHPLNHLIHAFEFGNELGQGAFKVDPKIYARELVIVKQMIEEFWPNPNQRPMLVGPDSNPNYEFEKILFDHLPVGTLDATTYHNYAGSGKDPDVPFKFVNKRYILESTHGGATYIDVIKETSPVPIPIWGGEVGPLYQGGQDNVSNTYMNAFWYAHHLAQLTQLGVSRFLRSTLSGGNYELIDKHTLLPNPDYFVALAWKKLIGRQGLALSPNYDYEISNVLVHALCGRKSDSIVIIFLNMSPYYQEININFEDYETNPHFYNQYLFYSDSKSLGIRDRNVYFRDADGYSVKMELGPNDAVPQFDAPVKILDGPIGLNGYNYAFLEFEKMGRGVCSN